MTPNGHWKHCFYIKNKHQCATEEDVNLITKMQISQKFWACTWIPPQNPGLVHIVFGHWSTWGERSEKACSPNCQLLQLWDNDTHTDSEYRWPVPFLVSEVWLSFLWPLCRDRILFITLFVPDPLSSTWWWPLWLQLSLLPCSVWLVPQLYCHLFTWGKPLWCRSSGASVVSEYFSGLSLYVTYKDIHRSKKHALLLEMLLSWLLWHGSPLGSLLPFSGHSSSSPCMLVFPSFTFSLLYTLSQPFRPIPELISITKW